MSELKTEKIVIKGLVQGIGYRPFVAETAEKYHVTGWVKNTNGIVTVLATAEPDIIERFAAGLKEQAPSGARVDALERTVQKTQAFDGFTIEGSDREAAKREIPQILPDLPTCERCRRELWDKSNRRYRHPFISCVSCGPRYSIIERIPYDRETITMADFALCPSCRKEYGAKGNVRRHAQTIACMDCGPVLRLEEQSGRQAEREAALKAAVELLKNDGILAVKDIGGYHLACSPYSTGSVKLLRELKGREKKPFAVMFSDVGRLKEYVRLSAREEEELASPPRPIVLLMRKDMQAEPFSEEVCKSSPDIGAMLPCNPLQELLLAECGVLVMTSANRSGEPMITENETMREWLFAAKECNIPLGILSHGRRIVTPLDDSVVRIINGRRQIFRRARGYVPTPVRLPGAYTTLPQLFAAGADLKACFAYAAEGNVYLSQYFGDMADEEIQRLYQRETVRMKELFGFAPEYAAADLHPGYQTLALARQSGLKAAQLQHHQAHVASVLAEHGLTEGVIGIAMDGTGYGTDHTVWGSEFFVCNGGKMQRAAHLQPVKLTGGDEGARNTDVMAYGYLAAAKIASGRLPKWLSAARYGIVRTALSQGINTVTSTSMGRLFDAVSALLDICHYNSYEGEAAIELEYLAARAKKGYPLHIELAEKGDAVTGVTGTLFSDIIEAQEQGVPAGELARGFILAVAEFITEAGERIGQRTGIKSVALSGGTFQNRILSETVEREFKKKGFQVYWNEQVPPGDGGISLGQAYLMYLRLVDDFNDTKSRKEERTECV